MKNVLIIILALVSVCFISCKKDDNVEIVRMRVNHYQQPTNNFEFSGLLLIVQEGDQIGKDRWYGFYNAIAGFDYELGYIYDLEVQTKPLEGPAIDRPDVVYSLVRILSKTKISQETTFDITLTIKFDNTFKSMVRKNEMSQLSLMGETVIDCGDLCGALEDSIKNQIGLIGTFYHMDDKTIRLLSLKTE